MIEAIKEIGECAVKGNLNRDIFLDGSCQKLVATRFNKKDANNPFKQHIVILNFNIESNSVEIDFEEINANGIDSGRKYLWVGNFKGNKPPLNVTSDRVLNILTKSLPLVKEKVENDFKKDLERVLTTFFNTVRIKDKKTEKLIYYINPHAFHFSNETLCLLKELEDHLDITKSKKDFENDLKSLIDEIEKNILRSVGLIPEEVSLYTIKINNQLACLKDEYRKMIYSQKIDNLFDEKGDYKNNFQKGFCSICGNSSIPTTSNTTNFDFKFYMTDKIGFSSSIDGNFLKNYNICKECYQHIILAENFIDSNLSIQMGGLDAYLIPHFISRVETIDMEDFSEYVIYSTSSVDTLESLKKFQKQLDRFRRYESKKNCFIINYLFYYHPRGSSEFKILKLIKDVSPSRLDFIRRTEENINNIINDVYGSLNNSKISISVISYCIPLKKQKNSYSGFSRYLDVIDSIFSGTNLNYLFLINQFTEVLRIIKFEKEGYNIRITEDFVTKILLLNFLLLFFTKLGILKGLHMNTMSNIEIDEIKRTVPRDILDYWKYTEIYKDDCKKTLFLIGFLIGEIGQAQITKGHKKKPILNKINFQGMGKEKVIRLMDDVLEKLRQYNKLQYNESVYSACKLMLDNCLGQWNLSNQENVFYILSGYAFSNYCSLQRYINGIDDDIKKKEAEISLAKEKGINVEKAETLVEEAKRLFYGQAKDYKQSKEILKEIEIKM